MPEKKTLERARKDRAEGKAPSTQAGEFVREEMDHIREAKHGARSTRQAIAIGLSRARRAGVELPLRGRGRRPPATRRKAQQDRRQGQRSSKSSSKGGNSTSPPRSRAATGALKREGRSAASPSALSRQARRSSARRPHGTKTKQRSGSKKK